MLYNIRRWFNFNEQAQIFAEKLSELLGLELSRTLSNTEIRLNLLTVSSLFPGLKVPILFEDNWQLESISTIEKTNDEFIDLKIDDTVNLYLNDILIRS